jgi:hypothetical protein
MNNATQEMNIFEYMDIYVGSLISLIRIYLNFKDLINFQRTCKTNHANGVLRNYFCEYEALRKSEAMARMIANLEDLQILDACKNFLKEFNAVIAGGFPLMHLVGDIWRDIELDDQLFSNDIDIFLPIQRGLDSDAIIECINAYFDVDYTPVTHDYIYVDEETKSSAITCRSNVHDKRVQIQFIITTEEDVKVYIDNNFDISYCKIWTDLEIITCKSFLAQIHRVGRIDNPKTVERTTHRIQKYAKRGFTTLED